MTVRLLHSHKKSKKREHFLEYISWQWFEYELDLRVVTDMSLYVTHVNEIGL